MKTMKSLFGQFKPDMMLWLPIQMITSILAMSCILFIFPSKRFKTRLYYLWQKMQLTTMELMFKDNKSNTSHWTSLLLSTFFVILMINLMGLFPYTFTITSHVSFTYSLAMPFWLSMNILGFYLSFKSRLSHLLPQGTPTFLIPMMIWMETLSLMAQPIALGLRLAANLTAGHLLLYLLSMTTWSLLSNPIISLLTFIVLILLFMLEIGVACMQAYVFTSLMKFYLIQKT